jgi:hypothetical protein
MYNKIIIPEDYAYILPSIPLQHINKKHQEKENIPSLSQNNSPASQNMMCQETCLKVRHRDNMNITQNHTSVTEYYSCTQYNDLNIN